MLRTTPEYAAAHLRDLAASGPQPGAAAIARATRIKRRQKLSRLPASIYRAIGQGV